MINKSFNSLAHFINYITRFRKFLDFKFYDYYLSDEKMVMRAAYDIALVADHWWVWSWLLKRDDLTEDVKAFASIKNLELNPNNINIQ